MSNLALNLFQPLLQGLAPLGDYTAVFGPTWRRSISRRGGFKIGTVNLTTRDITPDEMVRFFRYGLMCEIQETCGTLSWQGFISRLEWTHQGDVYSIDLANMYNARRALYRRLFDNLLSDGSAEVSSWTVYNGATVTQSSEWVADGSYSCKIVVFDAVVRGAYIQSTLTIVAGIAYSFTARMNILSGGWRLQARRSDNNQLIAEFNSGDQSGNVIASFSIPANNAYAGNIYLLAVNVHTIGPGTCYIDAAVFKPADQPADTGWISDETSWLVYGRREWIDLWGGMSDAAANAHVLVDLRRSAWPQPDVPLSGATRAIAVDPKEDKLSLVFSGYFATLNWILTRHTGSASASALVRQITALQSDYLVAGSIYSNTLPFTIEDSNPLRSGDVAKEICDSGDATGGLWSIGVYAGRQLDYQPVPPELTYHLRGGQLIHVAGAEMNPCLARPGWASIDDLPIGPGPISGHAQNDPRWRYLEEVEMLPPDSQHPDYWLAYSRDDNA
jgi:hypothetical protein